MTSSRKPCNGEREGRGLGWACKHAACDVRAAKLSRSNCNFSNILLIIISQFITFETRISTKHSHKPFTLACAATVVVVVVVVVFLFLGGGKETK